MPRLPFSLILSFAVVSLAAASSEIARLTLVNETGYNAIEVKVDAPIVPDSTDTTLLTGSVDIELCIDTATDQVISLNANSGAISGSPIELTAGGPFSLLKYDASSDTLGIDITTPSPPGSVNPATGEFDASDHQFIVNQGSLTGEVTYLGQTTPIDQDFSATPFGSTSEGTGTLSITLTSSTSTSKTYAMELIYPVSTTGTITQSGLTVNILNSGTVKATGSVTVELPTAFERWLIDNSLSGSNFGADSNGDGVPNGIQWALGLNAEADPTPHLPTLDRIENDAVHYSLDLPDMGSAADLIVLYTGDLQLAFTQLSSTAISSGNPIPSGSSGSVTIELPTGHQGYFLLQAQEP